MNEITAGGLNLLTWVRVNWFFVLFLATIAGAFVFFRTKPSNLEAVGGLEANLTNGQPTVLEFYSNF